MNENVGLRYASAARAVCRVRTDQYSIRLRGVGSRGEGLGIRSRRRLVPGVVELDLVCRNGANIERARLDPESRVAAGDTVGHLGEVHKGMVHHGELGSRGGRDGVLPVGSLRRQV